MHFLRAGESESGVFGSLEPEPLEEKVGKSEPLKNQPAPQPCEKIKRIRKLHFVYSTLGKKFLASFYG